MKHSRAFLLSSGLRRTRSINALHLTRPSRCGCNPCAPWAGSLVRYVRLNIMKFLKDHLAPTLHNRPEAWFVSPQNQAGAVLRHLHAKGYRVATAGAGKRVDVPDR